MSLLPTAIYTAPGIERTFETGEGPHSTNGKTTQISDIVLKAGGEDRDRPTEAKDTPLGDLRARLTTIQDDVNEFLTQRMKSKTEEEEEMERRILDGEEDNDSESD